MKTPQEIKAKELVEKFTIEGYFDYAESKQINIPSFIARINAIQCAKIAVEEIIRTLEKASDPYSTVMTIEYWQEVLECLNKM